MKEIFSTLTTHRKSQRENEIEILLSDHFDGSDTFRDFLDILYDPKKDEEILDIVSRIEFEKKDVIVAPSGSLRGDDIVYASGLKYCDSKNDHPSEKSYYHQAKGKYLQWLTYFDSDKQVAFTMEFYIFYRDQYGDICKLHADNNKVDVVVSGTSAEGSYVEINVTRGESALLDCGRYYCVFLLRNADGMMIDKPVVQYVNIIPAKSKVTRANSEMVGMEAVYRQMDSLAQQKVFNEQRCAMNLSPTPINLHAAVMGGKGSGKTSFAHVLLDFYVQNGLMESSKLHIVDATRWASMSMRDDSSVISDSFSMAEGGMLYIENAGSMIAADVRGNKDHAVQDLVSRLRDNTDNVTVVLADSPERITQLLAIADLKSYIGQIYKLPTLTIDQMMAIAERECADRKFTLPDGTKSAMKSYLSSLPTPTTEDVLTLIDRMVTRMSCRVVNDVDELFLSKDKLTTILPEDVPQPQVGLYEESMSKLNRLVGLKSLKYNIETHLNLVRFARLRQQNGLQATIPPLHMIFTGNPGTGKTTVASLLGEIYASIGILKTGHVVKVDRKKLVGQYIGDTEENTKRALQQAHGNILFIDEAYTLVGDPDDKRDFGPKVLDCLLDELGKENTDMIIILAGYPDEMEKLLKSNKGLQSRFPYTFHFEDYTEPELMEIAVKTAEKSGYSFSAEAYARLENLVHRVVMQRKQNEEKHFGNARYITRLISTRIIPNMSRRVLSATEMNASPLALSRIEAVDIPSNSSDTDYKIDEALISRTLNELDALIGREEIKRTLHDLVSLARTRQQSGDELTHTIPLQWTFTGPTGTGKSSVARILAQLLHAFHLISSNKMVQLRMPQTTPHMWSSYDIDRLLRDTMKQAGQGLLFIDLDDVSGTPIDVQWMRCKLTSLTVEMPGSYAFVIAVDSTRLPQQPIDMPLSTSVLHFSEYTADELMSILNQRLTKQGFSLSLDAAQEVYAHIMNLCENCRALANARTVKHICTALTDAAQLRIISLDKIPDSSEKYAPMEITREDVTSVKWNTISTTKIGFK